MPTKHQWLRAYPVQEFRSRDECLRRLRTLSPRPSCDTIPLARSGIGCNGQRNETSHHHLDGADLPLRVMEHQQLMSLYRQTAVFGEQKEIYFSPWSPTPTPSSSRIRSIRRLPAHQRSDAIEAPRSCRWLTSAGPFDKVGRGSTSTSAHTGSEHEALVVVAHQSFRPCSALLTAPSSTNWTTQLPRQV